MRTGLLSLFSIGLLAMACQPGAVQPAAEKAWGGDSQLGAAFDRASAESLAPTALLIAFSYEDTRFVAPPATLSHDGASARYGVMALQDGGVRDIARASALAGTSIDQVKTDDATNIRAAALLLNELATKQLGGLPRDIEGWRPIYKMWSTAGDANVQTGYADRIEQLMVNGVRAIDGAGRTLILHPVSEEDFQGFTHGPANGIGTHVEGVDFPGALWVAANSGNYTSGGEDTRYIVIHDMEGSYSGSISWFQNSAAQASAHYMVRSSDGQITQMVREADIAWHAGNWYYNQHAIGIEHEGYLSAPSTWYTEAMYSASARLSASIASRHGNIPIDNAHIFGHYQVPASGSGPPCSGTWAQCDTSAWGGANNHRDPGPGWNWTHYFDLINGGGTPRPEYAASYHAQSYTMDMTSGDVVTVYLEYTNDGSRTWDTTNTRVGTTMPRDRQSPFYDAANWIAPNRPTAADHSTYNTGAVGRFTFTMKAPDVTQTTMFTEHWGLVQESVTWFGPPDGQVWFAITVHPKSTPGGSGGSAGTPGGGSGGSGGGGGPGPSPTPNPGSGDMSGGCAAAPGMPSLSPLFLLALLALRRRK